MKKNYILGCIKKNLLYVLFFMVFYQNASIKDNILEPKKINLSWGEELNLLFNKKFILQSVAATLWLGVTAFLLKRIFFSDGDELKEAQLKINKLLEKNLEADELIKAQEIAIKDIQNTLKKEKDEILKEEENDKLLDVRLAEAQKEIDLLKKQSTEMLSMLSQNQKFSSDQIAENTDFKKDINLYINKIKEDTGSKIDLLEKGSVQLNNEYLVQFQNKKEELEMQIRECKESYNNSLVSLNNTVDSKAKKQVEEHNTLLAKVIREYEQKLKECENKYTEKIENLSVSYVQQLQEVKDINKKIEERLEKQIGLQEEANQIAKNEYEIKKQECEKKQNKENHNAKFHTQNTDLLKQTTEILDTMVDSISNYSLEKGEEFFELELKRIKNNNQYNLWEPKNIIDYVLSKINVKSWVGIDLESNDCKESYIPNLEELLSYQKIKKNVDVLIMKYNEVKNKINQYPELHPIYKKNNQLIKNIIEEYNKFIFALKESKISAKEEKIYNSIIINYQQLTDKILFENALEILNLEDDDQNDSLLDLYCYLSSRDKGILNQLIAQLNKEKELRKKDHSRQYQCWLNLNESNKSRIDNYKEKIMLLVNAFSPMKVSVYEEYEKYENYKNNDQIDNSISLLVKIDGSISIKDDEKEIITSLLDLEFKKFKEAMEKESGIRKLTPERHSIYEKIKNQIQEIINHIKLFDEYIKSIDTTMDENSKYVDLFSKIDFAKEYSNVDFIAILADSISIDFKDVQFDDMVLHLTKDQQNIIKNFYNNLLLENKKRQGSKIRQYQWYINKNTKIIDSIKEKIRNVALCIKNNKDDDRTYEDYAAVLNNSNDIHIVNKIINDLKINDLEVLNIIDCFDSELKELQNAFKQETSLRCDSIDRCYIGKKNKVCIDLYYKEMKNFFDKLHDINNIDEDTNNDYMTMSKISLEENNFFIETVKLFKIQFIDATIMDVFKILNFENKSLLSKYIELIVKEIDCRRLDKKRENQWYVNKTKLQDNINSINSIIQLFIGQTKQDSFSDVTCESLYLQLMKYLNNEREYKDNYKIIELLFQYYCPVEESFDWDDDSDNKNHDVLKNTDIIDYNKLTAHIDSTQLIKFIKEEEQKRLIDPERSFFYKDFKKDIERIMNSIEELNKVMGNHLLSTNAFVNKFFKFVFEDKGLSAVNEMALNDIGCKLFFNLCQGYFNIQSGNDLWCFLSRHQIENIKKLIFACDKEKNLREVFASRGLGDEDIQILAGFRQWLNKDIYIPLVSDSLVSRNTIFGMYGIEGLACIKESLYVYFFKLYCEKNRSDKDLAYTNTLVKYLDQDDKNTMDSIQKLLQTVLETAEKNKEDLVKEKRILKSVLTCDLLNDRELIINDDIEKAKLQEITQNKNKLVEDVDAKKREILEESKKNIKTKKDASAQNIQQLLDENKKYREHIQGSLMQETLLNICYGIFSSQDKHKKDVDGYILQTLGIRMLLHYGMMSEKQGAFLKKCLEINSLEKFDNFFKELLQALGKKNSLCLSGITEELEGSKYKYDMDSFLYLCSMLLNQYPQDMTTVLSVLKKILSYKTDTFFEAFRNQGIKFSVSEIVFLVDFVLKAGINIKEAKQNDLYKALELKLDTEDSFFNEKKSWSDFLPDNENSLNSFLLVEENSKDAKKENGFFNMLRNISDISYNATKENNNIDLSIIIDNKKNEAESQKLKEIFYIISNLFVYPFVGCGMLKKNMEDLNAGYYKISGQKSICKDSKLEELIRFSMPIYMQEYYNKNKLDVQSDWYYYVVSKEDKLKSLSAFIAKDNQIKENLQKDIKQIENKRDKDINNVDSDSAKELKKLDFYIGETTKILTEKEKGNRISQEDIIDIPERIIKYSFIVKISNKILQLIKKNDIELKKILDTFNLSEEFKNDLADCEFVLEQLFNTVSIIESLEGNNIINKEYDIDTEYCSFLYSIGLKANSIENVDILRQYLCARLDDDLDVEQHRAHFIFNGLPGTGKTAFIKYSIYKILQKYSSKQKLHSYLKENILLFNIAKSSYSSGLNSIESGLSDDINTILKVYSNPILFVQMDEIDDLVRKRGLVNGSNKSTEDAAVNMALTLMDNQTVPFSLIGTTNLKKDEIDEAIIRAGRAILREFLIPNVLQVRCYLERKKIQLEELIKSSNSKEYKEKKRESIDWINKFNSKDDISSLLRLCNNLKNTMSKKHLSYLLIDEALTKKVNIFDNN